ncbi:MAG: thioredoxin [Patescibacteria group bacterium]|nr:thioredoxin [Patescibacteria group bacterium]
MAQAFTDDNFEAEVIQAESLVLVDFHAAWCGPCQMQGPIIDELAEANSDIKIGKVDVDSAPETAKKYGVMSIPTLIFFKGGEVVEKMSGLQQRDKLEAKIAELK